MKSIILSLLCIFTFGGLSAQECTNFYYLINNAEVQMTVYNPKGKENGKQTWKVSEVKKEGNGYRSTINSTFTDEKGKEGAKSTGVYKCEGGVLKADIRMALPPEQMQANKDMEVKADEVYIEYPANMSVGQSLPDAEFKMETSNQGGVGSTITFKETSRKVEGKEPISSPAGNWEAYKITYDGLFKIAFGGIGIPMNMKVTEWYVPGFGLVKTETYSKNGKLMGSTLITSVKK